MKPNFRWKESKKRRVVHPYNHITHEDPKEKIIEKRISEKIFTTRLVSPDVFTHEFVAASPNKCSEQQQNSLLCSPSSEPVNPRTKVENYRWSSRWRAKWRPDWRISLGMVLVLCVLNRVAQGESDATYNSNEADNEDTVIFTARRLNSISDVDYFSDTDQEAVLRGRVKAETVKPDTPCGKGRGQQVKIQYSSSIVENGKYK